MKFIKAFFLSTMVIFSLIMGIVYSVDPYEKLGNNLFNFKTKAVAQSRENKYRMLQDSKSKNYEAFILGSSAAHRFQTKTLKSLTGLESFNYAVQHTTPEDYLAIIKHILSKYKPKLILLQIGFNELNKTFQTDNRLYNSSLNKFLQDDFKENSTIQNDYITLDAVRDTFKVIWNNLMGKTIHNVYTKDGNYINEKPVKGEVKVSQASYKDYSISQKRLKVLTQIKDLSSKHNFKIIAFAAILSPDHMAKIKKSRDSLWHEYLIFHSEIKRIFGNFYLWNDKVILNKYDSTIYFRDSAHITKNFSDTILNELINGPIELRKD